MVYEGLGGNQEEVGQDFQNEFEASEDYGVYCNNDIEAYMIVGVDFLHERNQILLSPADVTTTVDFIEINKVQNSLVASKVKPLMTV